MFKRLKNKKGFTLIELIVVIAILGILAAIAVPRLGGFTDQAKKVADEQAAATIAKAMEFYYVTNYKTIATPANLVTADLIDVKTLEPVYQPSTNKGFSAELDSNGKATVYYSLATSKDGTGGAAAWPAKTGTALYPKP